MYKIRKCIIVQLALLGIFQASYAQSIVNNEFSISSSERIISSIGLFKGKSYVLTERNDDQKVYVLDQNAEVLEEIEFELEHISGNIKDSRLYILNDIIQLIFSVYDRSEKKDVLYHSSIDPSTSKYSDPVKLVEFNVPIKSFNKFIIKRDYNTGGLCVGYIPKAVRNDPLTLRVASLSKELKVTNFVEDIVLEKNSLAEIRDFGCDKAGNIFVYTVEFSSYSEMVSDNWDDITAYTNAVYVYKKGYIAARKVDLDTKGYLLSQLKIIADGDFCQMAGLVSKTTTKNYDAFASFKLDVSMNSFDMIIYQLTESFLEESKEKAFLSLGNSSNRSTSYPGVYNHNLQYAYANEGKLYLVTEALRVIEDIPDRTWAYGYNELTVFESMYYEKNGNLVIAELDPQSGAVQANIVERGTTERGNKTYAQKYGTLFANETVSAAYIIGDKVVCFNLDNLDTINELTFDQGYSQWTVVREIYEANVLLIVGKRGSKLSVNYLKF